MSNDQRAFLQRADNDGGVHQLPVFAVLLIEMVDVDQAGACLVFVVGLTIGLLRVVVDGQRQGQLVFVPVFGFVVVPEAVQGFADLMPAGLVGGDGFIPVVQLLLLIGHEQQARQAIEQAADGIDLHRQLDAWLHTRLPGQEVFPVDVGGCRARQGEPYQRVSQGFEPAVGGQDLVVADGPGGCNHHGQVRIDVQLRILGVEGGADRGRSDFPERRAGHQLSEYVVGIVGGYGGHGRFLCPVKRLGQRGFGHGRGPVETGGGR
ncbi:hypothetical protein D3C76_790350 [compost metagenome]